MKNGSQLKAKIVSYWAGPVANRVAKCSPALVVARVPIAKTHPAVQHTEIHWPGCDQKHKPRWCLMYTSCSMPPANKNGWTTWHLEISRCSLKNTWQFSRNATGGRVTTASVPKHHKMFATFLGGQYKIVQVTETTDFCWLHFLNHSWTLGISPSVRVQTNHNRWVFHGLSRRTMLPTSN